MGRWSEPLEKADEYRWRIPQSYKAGMRVPGLIYVSEEMMEHIVEEQAPEQVANVAFLPGIVGYSSAMPDIHWPPLLPSIPGETSQVFTIIFDSLRTFPLRLFCEYEASH